MCIRDSPASMPRKRIAVLNLNKRSNRSTINTTTNRLFSQSRVFVWANTGGPIHEGQGHAVCVPRLEETFLSACTRLLKLPKLATKLYEAESGRLTKFSKLEPGRDYVLIAEGEKLKRPVGNSGYFISSGRGNRLSVCDWLKRHGLKGRGLTLERLLKRTLFAHGVSKCTIDGRPTHVEAGYCRVASPSPSQGSRCLFEHYRMPDGTHCHILPGMGKQLLQQLPKLAREVSQAVTRYQQVAEAAAGVCANVVSPKAVADVISGECPVFVLDTNESMKGMRFHQLRCCCVGLLDKLRGTGRRFSILTYDPKVKCEGMADGRGGESVREEHVKTVTQAQDWVLKLKLGGGVTIMDSLMIAMSAPQGDAVYFLTYGFGNERAFMRVRDLVRDATQPLCVEVHSAPRDKSVHTVALDANVKSKEWLGEIADSGKGIAYVCDTESAEKALEDAGIDISLFKRDDLQLLQDEAADATSQCEKIHRLQRELRTELDRIIWGTMVLHNGRDAPNETDALITSLDKVFAVDGSPAPLSPAGQSPSRDEWLRSSGCPAQLVSQMRSLFQMLDEQHRGFLCRDNLGGVFDIIEKDWPEHEAAHLAEAAWAPDGRMLFDGFLRFFLEFLDCNFRHIDSSRNGLILSSRDAELVPHTHGMFLDYVLV
eukprot:TRINITY_DN1935_c0_g1_i44.p1 TRINITY_DN1935_c0_g1~~TRINITY_DN1935_c0_g1_i44.p1  ORF type:complete len:654 (-),score=138.02 TRINITY_DN1935_c0_g1_i44:1027-2988(-)